MSIQANDLRLLQSKKKEGRNLAKGSWICIDTLRWGGGVFCLLWIEEESARAWSRAIVSLTDLSAQHRAYHLVRIC